ncbi:hypothetical protein [Novosphingobium sp.]|uniref:hypothetical protein n=1 Tax=Novosphingobium sp. TaxID=1874826 RepID=UPI0026064702|nr:hypothetical protein [Novosphingobium sp.]
MTDHTPPYGSDDIAFWPDGTWGTPGDVRVGEYAHMTDVNEIVRCDDHARLKALGVEEDLEIDPR